jgi:hypothetical protein
MTQPCTSTIFKPQRGTRSTGSITRHSDRSSTDSFTSERLSGATTLRAATLSNPEREPFAAKNLLYFYIYERLPRNPTLLQLRLIRFFGFGTAGTRSYLRIPS